MHLPLRGLLAGIVLLCLGLGTAERSEAQRCATDRSSSHDAWHPAYRARDSLRSRIVEYLSRRGISDSTGAVHVRGDSTRSLPEVSFIALDWPSDVRRAVRTEVLYFLRRLPPSDWTTTLQLDAPTVPLWQDRTERCAPATINDTTVQRLVAEVVMDHPMSRMAGVEIWTAASLLLYVDPEGAVTRVEVVELEGDEWFRPRLDSVGRAMEFEPAILNGTPVGTWVTRNVVFGRGRR